MRISRVAVQAFRSLYGVELRPRPFTVLIGPNNAGKTTLAEALDFLADVYRHGVETAVARKGGYENIAHRRMRRTKQAIVFRCEVELRYGEVQSLLPEFLTHFSDAAGGPAEARRALRESSPRLRVRHWFELKAAAQRLGSDFSVKREEFVVDMAERDEPWSRILEVNRVNGEVEVSAAVAEAWNTDDTPTRITLTEALQRAALSPFPDEGFTSYVVENLDATNLLMQQLAFFNQLARYVQRTLAAGRLYQLVPLECRRPGIPTPNPELERHGYNLPALVRHMQGHDQGAWQRVFQSMQRIVPTLTNIGTDFSADRRLTLFFQEEGVGRPWNSEEISDGTIQSLAMFAALFDSRSPLTVIEEPENSVHPWILRVFVDACREAEKQVVITTHSPAVINYLRPEEVTVVWREGGRTHVAALTDLDPAAELMWESGQSTIFDIIDSGWLPQTVPEAYR
jgi:predicted ATPase